MACSVFREQFRGQFPQGSAFALGRQQNGARCEQYIFKFPAYTKREAVPYSELLRRALRESFFACLFGPRCLFLYCCYIDAVFCCDMIRLPCSHLYGSVGLLFPSLTEAPSNSVDGLKEFIVSRLRKPRAGRKRPRGQEAPEQNRGASAALPVPGTNHLPAALPSITASSTAGPSAVGLASPASLYFNPFTSTDHNCNATASAATAATLHAGALSGLLPTPFMSGVLFNPDDTGTVLHPPASYIAGAVSVPSSFPLMMSSVTDSATASAVDAAASTNPARCDSVGLCPTTPCATPTFFAPIGAAPLSTPLGGVDYCWGRGRRQHHGHRRGGAPQQRGAGRDVGASHAAAAIPPVPQQAGQVVPVASGAGRVARGDDPRSLDSAQYQRGGRITARSGAHRCREWHGGSSMKLARGYYCGVPPLLPP